MGLFVSDALAATATGTAAQPDGTFSMIMVVVIFVLFYFMLIRPQNKRAKEHRELVSKLQKGDEIVTSGGFLGSVVDLNDQYLKVRLAEGMDVMLQRGAVSSVLPKGTLKSL
ncbi:SecYEG protein translocase auxillary subunit [Legionella geestiana]|uniref:Sec translocon accessory complex subunit YajC n=1 Tax=Legionella geestiana TaxID=45065 RepID=A0A0W0TW99_9GAMM|nr:preprotein translocase subunit YajC [Legionella geestiana]KTC99881.1 SecYEG protein translocase auxillary subunit [Legionella geestiana]QBS13233.1 preprotein translocase subunit YajC [Legionella geestiana]QDQ39088.1 preprotein translocase subunit YajC [Legionella geestiana]STX54243.1 SecYEG protein translocase auxillary subunit [Legionella geestiana]